MDVHIDGKRKNSMSQAPPAPTGGEGIINKDSLKAFLMADSPQQ